jgi:hypothetical protein
MAKVEAQQMLLTSQRKVVEATEKLRAEELAREANERTMLLLPGLQELLVPTQTELKACLENVTTAVMRNVEESARMLANVSVEKSVLAARSGAKGHAGVDREELEQNMMSDFQRRHAEAMKHGTSDTVLQHLRPPTSATMLGGAGGSGGGSFRQVLQPLSPRAGALQRQATSKPAAAAPGLDSRSRSSGCVAAKLSSRAVKPPPTAVLDAASVPPAGAKPPGMARGESYRSTPMRLRTRSAAFVGPNGVGRVDQTTGTQLFQGRYATGDPTRDLSTRDRCCIC